MVATLMDTNCPLMLCLQTRKATRPDCRWPILWRDPWVFKMLRPEQENRAFDVPEEKFYTNGSGKRDGWGLKCFP